MFKAHGRHFLPETQSQEFTQDTLGSLKKKGPFFQKTKSEEEILITTGLAFVSRSHFWKELEYANMSWVYTDISSPESGLQGVPWYLLVYVRGICEHSVLLHDGEMMEYFRTSTALLYEHSIREVMLGMS